MNKNQRLPADQTRPPGFYWVRYGILDDWLVAEWIRESHRDGKPAWYLPGDDAPCKPSEITEVDERRLIREVRPTIEDADELRERMDAGETLHHGFMPRASHKSWWLRPSMIKVAPQAVREMQDRGPDA